MDKLLTKKLIFKTIIFVGIFFVTYLWANNIFLKWKSYSQIESFLINAANRTSNDLKYINNKWNTSFYLSDTEITSDNPLYIFTTEGFLIDRTNNINGFLDTADFNYVNSFKDFTTLTSPINEVWRVYSLPIINKESIEGSILVSVLFPKLSALKEIDNDLLINVNKINSMIAFKDGKLDTSSFDMTKVDYGISYIVVDRFNKILLEDGGPPAYIDRSYIRKFLKDDNFEIIKDEITKEKFLIAKKTIQKSDGSSIGLIIVGRSLETLEDILMNQTFFSLLSGFILFLLILIVSTYLFNKELSQTINEKAKGLFQSMVKKNKPKFLNPKRILFDKENHFILLDKYKLNIFPDTNQYYFCKTLFSKPQKKWENDELLDDFVGNRDNPRAVYDCYF